VCQCLFPSLPLIHVYSLSIKRNLTKSLQRTHIFKFQSWIRKTKDKLYLRAMHLNVGNIPWNVPGPNSMARSPCCRLTSTSTAPKSVQKNKTRIHSTTLFFTHSQSWKQMNDCLTVKIIVIRISSNKEFRSNLKTNLPSACISTQFYR
jgi:hypothetical protein